MQPLILLTQHSDSDLHGAGLLRHPALDHYNRKTHLLNREVVYRQVDAPVKELYHAAVLLIRRSAKWDL